MPNSVGRSLWRGQSTSTTGHRIPERSDRSSVERQLLDCWRMPCRDRHCWHEERFLPDRGCINFSRFDPSATRSERIHQCRFETPKTDVNRTTNHSFAAASFIRKDEPSCVRYLCGERIDMNRSDYGGQVLTIQRNFVAVRMSVRARAELSPEPNCSQPGPQRQNPQPQEKLRPSVNGLHSVPTGQNSPSRTLCEHGLVELGAFRTNSLRRSPKVVFYPWKPISTIPEAPRKAKKPKPDPMKLAHEYQALLDSGVVHTRAELARHLGVSRARVTQVLNRLKRA
jgi:hypothetical protein